MTEANDAVIVAATRTPIGRSGRALAGLTVADIGMQTVTGVIGAAGLDARRHRRPHSRRGPARGRLHRPLRGQRAGAAARHAGRRRAAPVRHRA